MDLVLNIYEKGKVVNTFKAETYDLMMGTVEDILAVIDIDSIQANDKVELFKVVAKALANSMDTIKSLLKDVFDGLTDEDIKKAKMSEVIDVLMEIIKYSINQMSIGVKNAKN